MEPENRAKTELHYYSQRLRCMLGRILTSRAVIVEAPSGYGKTTAIRDFLKSGIPQGIPVHWFAASDESAAAGFRRLCHEIDKIDGAAGQRLFKIEFPNAATTGEACDALRSIRCNRETYLVIDNFQFMQPELPPAFFKALIEHGGEGLHIIVLTQVLKRNMLPMIAGHGFLHITAADLRLNEEDIRAYYSLAGVRIAPEDAGRIARHTEGWIIAVYLQLCALKEKRTLSDMQGILSLMEHLVWHSLTQEQQTFLLRLSPFETATVRQACELLGCDTLPPYALETLEIPFIRYDPAARQYELHSILIELLAQKRTERGAAFERACLVDAGDYYRREGKKGKALEFYSQVCDYERMLSLDLSDMTLEMIGNRAFCELAADMAQNCPAEIKRRHILSMLQVAWALLTADKKELFDTAMEELRGILDAESSEEKDWLTGEWLLLSSFKHSPRLSEMTPVLRQAAALLKGRRSRVILAAAPWCFGNHSPLAEFHIRPGEADREADAMEEYISVYTRLTNGSGSGADALFRAELAYHRGQINEAEVLAYKAVYLAESRKQSIVQLGATMYLADIALHKRDAAGWQNALDAMERAASYPGQNNYIVRATLDIVRGVLLNELKNHENIAEWLKSGDFGPRRLPPCIVPNAIFDYLMYFVQRGEFARIVGISEAKYPEGAPGQPFRDYLYCLTLASGYLYAGSREKAEELVRRAAKTALPDGLIFPFASYAELLQGMTEELIEKEYPEHREVFREIKARFLSGWNALRDAIFADELPASLTPREYEVAKLAAEGLRNSEIADKIHVTESTVRAHLRVVFQKLDIDRRIKLAEKLKA